MTGRGQPQHAGKWQTVEDKTPVYAIKHAGFDDRPIVGVGHVVFWQLLLANLKHP